MKKFNPVDSLVENLIVEFVKIPNFDLNFQDERAKKILNIFTFRIADVVAYRDLVCQHFVPATNKAIFESKRAYRESKYKYLLKNRDIDFEETLFNIVGLAYVGLFHKLENYINEVITIPDLIFGDSYKTEENLAKWAKDHFNFGIKDWWQFPITHKIDWVCNCVKHKDGYPLKTPKPLGYEFADEKIRLRITPKEFKEDCTLLMKFYPIYLEIMFLFAEHKLFITEFISRDDRCNFPDSSDIHVENQKKIEEKISIYIELLRKK